MSNQQVAGDNTIGAHEVAMAKYNLGSAGRLLERQENHIGMLTALVNILANQAVSTSVTAEQFEAAKKMPLLVEITLINDNRFFIDTKGAVT